jgi:hypothetical protein
MWGFLNQYHTATDIENVSIKSLDEIIGFTGMSLLLLVWCVTVTGCRHG